MKKSILLFAVIILGFTSCYQVEKPEKPEKLLTEAEMAHIILDLSIAGAAKGINKKLLEENDILPRDFVLKNHQIDSALFAQNNHYYSYDLEAFDRIYISVKDSLEVLKKIAQENSYIKVEKIKEEKVKNKLKTKFKDLKIKDSQQTDLKESLVK